MNSWRTAATALRNVCSPPRKVVLSGRWFDLGLLARSYVRREDGDLRISNAKPRRWNALHEISRVRSKVKRGGVKYTSWSLGEREACQDGQFGIFRGNIVAVLERWQFVEHQLICKADIISKFSQLRL